MPMTNVVPFHYKAKGTLKETRTALKRWAEGCFPTPEELEHAAPADIQKNQEAFAKHLPGAIAYLESLKAGDAASSRRTVNILTEEPTVKARPARQSAARKGGAEAAPTTEKPTVERQYLTGAELEKLMRAARAGRYGHRDATAILLAYRHGLRVSELCSMTWTQIDFVTQRLTVARVKNGQGAPHPLQGDEMRALRRLQREQPAGSRFIFMNERRAPMSPDGFQKTLARIGDRCGLAGVHSHMLRHSCGFALAEKGVDVRQIQDYLGHVNIQNTTWYTAMAPNRHDKIWN
jgi:integrase